MKEEIKFFGISVKSTNVLPKNTMMMISGTFRLFDETDEQYCERIIRENRVMVLKNLGYDNE